MKLRFSISVVLIFLFTSNIFGQKENLEGIEVGAMAPEIELSGLAGETVSLSQLQGKIVLINFWASWCAPCRKKSPYLRAIFNEYKELDFEDGEKGFVIFNVSLDKNEIAWKNSIRKDSVGAFINVGDMKGWDCTAAKTYNIRKIPTSLLLDGTGKIIAINLHTRDLEKKLKRMKKGGFPWFF